MSARDITAKELEESLKNYGMTMRWHNPPWKELAESEGAEIRLHDEHMGCSYSLRKGWTRRALRAWLIAEAEKMIESRKRRQRSRNSEQLYAALMVLLEKPNDPDTRAYAQSVLTQATYDGERNATEMAERRARIEAEKQQEAKNA